MNENKLEDSKGLQRCCDWFARNNGSRMALSSYRCSLAAPCCIQMPAGGSDYFLRLQFCRIEHLLFQRYL